MVSSKQVQQRKKRKGKVLMKSGNSNRIQPTDPVGSVPQCLQQSDKELKTQVQKSLITKEKGAAKAKAKAKVL